MENGVSKFNTEKALANETEEIEGVRHVGEEETREEEEWGKTAK